LTNARHPASASKSAPRLLFRLASPFDHEVVPMEESAQFLGHSDVNVTCKVYARFSPDYLRKAAASLEYDDIGALKRRKTA
jgi:hypothetical protein